jgi:hypothetical protein
MRRPPRDVLVLSASEKAQRQAAALDFHGVLENQVERALRAGDVSGGTWRIGQDVWVLLREHGIRVKAKLALTRSGRRAWIPLQCERLDRRAAA